MKVHGRYITSLLFDTKMFSKSENRNALFCNDTLNVRTVKRRNLVHPTFVSSEDPFFLNYVYSGLINGTLFVRYLCRFPSVVFSAYCFSLPTSSFICRFSNFCMHALCACGCA